MRNKLAAVILILAMFSVMGFQPMGSVEARADIYGVVDNSVEIRRFRNCSGHRVLPHPRTPFHWII